MGVAQACVYLRETRSIQLAEAECDFIHLQYDYNAIALPDYGVEVAVIVDVGVDVGVEVAVEDGVIVGVDDAVAVAVEEGVAVNVAVGGCAPCRVIRGLTHSAKSSWEVPFASTVRTNFTFSPLSGLKSTLAA